MQMRLVYSFGGTKNTFYGTLRLFNSDNSSFFAGTFYWLNCKGIYREMRNHNIEIPKCSDRYIAENFPYYINQCYFNTMSSINGYYLEFEENSCCNWYLYSKQYCEMCNYLDEEFYKLFNLAIKKEYI